jgi:hypothetical protein
MLHYVFRYHWHPLKTSLVLLALCLLAHGLQARTWTFADGTSLEAQLKQFRNNVVTLKTATGLRMFSLDKFAEADKKWLLAQNPSGDQSAAGTQTTPPAPPSARAAPPPSESRPTTPPRMQPQNRHPGLGLPRGAHAPEMTFYTAQNEPVELMDVRGKLAVICFWGPEYSGSYEQLLTLLKVQSYFTEQHLQVFVVTVTEDVRLARQMLRDIKVPFYRTFDNEGDKARLWQLRHIPTNVLLDANADIILQNIDADQLGNLFAQARREAQR